MSEDAGMTQAQYEAALDWWAERHDSLAQQLREVGTVLRDLSVAGALWDQAASMGWENAIEYRARFNAVNDRAEALLSATGEPLEDAA